MLEKMLLMNLYIVFNIDLINNQVLFIVYHKKMQKMYVVNYKEVVSMRFIGEIQFENSIPISGIKAGCYHAGLSGLARTQVHERWLKNQVHVICATIAFG
jgi:penicillin-binding protein-related factor A (putative recombinase)